jgi:hypothetical protein
MSLQDFIETAQKIRSLEWEYNEMRENAGKSTLGELLKKSNDSNYEISEVLDRGPDGEILWYSNRKVLEDLKLIDKTGRLNKFVDLILCQGSKIAHWGGNTRVVITYKELSTAYSEGEKKAFLSTEEKRAAPHFSWLLLQRDSQETRNQLNRYLGKHRREE